MRPAPKPKSSAKGPVSYDELRRVSQFTVQAIRSLNALGLTWSAIFSMRAVSRVAVRFAGGYESAGRKEPGGGGHCISAPLRVPQSRLESAAIVGLYNSFDVLRGENEILVDPIALLEAWSLFREQYPDHRLTIHHAWLLARANLQKEIVLVRCTACSGVHLKASDHMRTHPDYIALTEGCYVCDRRRIARSWLINRQSKQSRGGRRKRDSVSSSSAIEKKTTTAVQVHGMVCRGIDHPPNDPTCPCHRAPSQAL